MEKKKYSSYAQIENDLKMFKTEREIHYQNIRLNIHKTKESLMPSKTISFVKAIYENVFSGTLGTIIKIAIPFLVNRFVNKKRGD
jgi:acyl-[acyl carrier protein]--UDP-N-acetylglucosamine O-acyltransferase